MSRSTPAAPPCSSASARGPYPLSTADGALCFVQRSALALIRHHCQPRLRGGAPANRRGTSRPFAPIRLEQGTARGPARRGRLGGRAVGGPGRSAHPVDSNTQPRDVPSPRARSSLLPAACRGPVVGREVRSRCADSLDRFANPLRLDHRQLVGLPQQPVEECLLVGCDQHATDPGDPRSGRRCRRALEPALQLRATRRSRQRRRCLGCPPTQGVAHCRMGIPTPGRGYGGLLGPLDPLRDRVVAGVPKSAGER